MVLPAQHYTEDSANMRFKSNFNIIWLVLLQFVTIFLFSYFLLNKSYILAIILAPIIIYEIFYFYNLNHHSRTEFQQFVEAVQFGDFSRHFNLKKSPAGLKLYRRGFNEINTVFRSITKEKETQYQYLQKVLELVDTGILSYQVDDGDVIWMNESLKKLLDLPYLKTIHSLEKRDLLLYQQVIDLTPGQRVIWNLDQNKSSIKIVLSSTSFITGDTRYKLVVFQNVNEALDETESKAWQKLLSVMTHEIMNSVAPISSLANTLQKRMKDLPIDANLAEDLELGIQTIKNRSEGLLKFTETYRNLNKINKATLEKVQVSELFGNIYRLMQPNLKHRDIEVEIILPEPLLTVMIDVGLIEQVLINLILNAIDAVKNIAAPKITLSAYSDNDSKTIIKVADNGTGMSPEVLENIFIPFFSTKKNGNGIGLNLCKQIMQVHKGTISVKSIPEQGTAFYLRF